MTSIVIVTCRCHVTPNPAQDTFSQVVCLDTWSRLMAYDEHTVSYTHNIGVFVQTPKQFTMSALVGNSVMSRSLSAFLAAFSRPVRGLAGSLAYHTEHIGKGICKISGFLLKYSGHFKQGCFIKEAYRGRQPGESP